MVRLSLGHHSWWNSTKIGSIRIHARSSVTAGVGYR